jgi:WD40 repeat protein
MHNGAVRLAKGALFMLAAVLGILTSQANAQSSPAPTTSAEYPAEVVTLQGPDSVSSVAFSPDGQKIAASGDHTVKIWDASRGRELLTLRGHADIIWSAAFSPDGRTIASGSSDHTIKLWSAVNGRELRTLRGHTDIVDQVAFSPDGRKIASVGVDRTVRLWDAATGRGLWTLRGHSDTVLSVAFSPNGRIVASGSVDHTIKLWDAATGRELRTLRGHTEEVKTAAYSPDGQTIASGGKDDTIKIWDAATGQELRTLRGHSDTVLSVAFSPNGRIVASGSRDGAVKLWDAATGRELRSLQQHTEYAWSVAFSPDGRTVASGGNDHTVKLWDVSTLTPAPTTISSEEIKKAPSVIAPTTVLVDGSPRPSKTVGPTLERRVALVIGNSAYRKVQHLPNPSRDADLIGAALRNAGIEDVTIAHDLDRDGMLVALKTFARKADAADWAVIYFAGHGIEIGGINYLIPIDAKLETDRDVSEETVSLQQLQAKVAGAHKLKLIVLDACRNNPFASQMRMTVASRSINRGFARIEPTGATLVVYAAKEGTTAADGDSVSSPFALSFAKRVVEQGVEINKALRFVRQDVLQATGNQQEPFVYGSLPPEDFYFVPPK